LLPPPSAVRDEAAQGAAEAASAFAAAPDAEDNARLATLLASARTTLRGAIIIVAAWTIHIQMASVIVSALAALLHPAAVPARPLAALIDVEGLAAAVPSALNLSTTTATSSAGAAAGGPAGPAGKAWLAREYEAAIGAARLVDTSAAAATVTSRLIAASVRAGVQAAPVSSVVGVLDGVRGGGWLDWAVVDRGGGTVNVAGQRVMGVVLGAVERMRREDPPLRKLWGE